MPRGPVEPSTARQGHSEGFLRTARIIVTEVGYLFNDYVNPNGRVNDAARIEYYDAAFRAAHRAMSKGVDLRGIYVWTLLDDFEWDSGYSSRYGIVFVDYRTQARTPKDSAYWLRDVAMQNGLATS